MQSLQTAVMSSTSCIVSGSEPSNLVIIQDNQSHNGRAFLRGYTKSLLTRVDAVHLFIFDSVIDSYRQYYDKQDYKGKILLHDGCSDVAGWIESSEKEGIQWQPSDGIYSQFDAVLRNCEGAVAIVIDSLSPLLICNTTNHVCSALRQLRGCKGSPCNYNIVQMVALLHSDLHDDYSAAAIKYIASTVVELESIPEEDRVKSNELDNSFYQGICNVRHVKKSGKLSYKKEIYGIYEDFAIRTFEKDSLKTVSSFQADNDKVDPTANLTFNLKLTQSQKEARAVVRLPYTHSEERKAVELGRVNPSSGSKIFYQPDEADDYDEEDPDDDLDI